MIDPRYVTGCSGFDKATDVVSPRFSRTRTQFSYNIPRQGGHFLNEERRLPTFVIDRARAVAPGGVLHEFGNQTSSRRHWRTHGWIAVDANGATVGCWRTPAVVSQKVIEGLRSKLFQSHLPVGIVRFPGIYNNDRSSIFDGERIAARNARIANRIAQQRQAEARQFAAQTTAQARLQELDRQAEETLEALLENA